MKPTQNIVKHHRADAPRVAGHATTVEPRARAKRALSRRKQGARPRRAVDIARLAAVTIHPAEREVRTARTGSRKALTLGAAALALLAGFLWWNRNPAATESGDVFLFEEPPPEAAPQARPDPTPPPPQPVAETPPETPPPQFGLQEEQLSEAGDLSVATGNTLMTEADSIVNAPVAALPTLPPLVDQAPRILKGRAPEYPYRALERGLEASVVVLITIDTLGRVSQVDVERSGGRDFDPEVLRAVKSMVFQPPVRDGRRMAARFRQPYEFKIQ